MGRSRKSDFQSQAAVGKLPLIFGRRKHCAKAGLHSQGQLVSSLKKIAPALVHLTRSVAIFNSTNKKQKKL
jgi:hypothetical protein